MKCLIIVLALTVAVTGIRNNNLLKILDSSSTVSEHFYLGPKGGVCPGKTISTYAQCTKAIAELGRNYLNHKYFWQGSVNTIPKGCSFSSNNGHFNTFQFNKGSPGQGRGDLTPVCLKQAPLPKYVLMPSRKVCNGDDQVSQGDCLAAYNELKKQHVNLFKYPAKRGLLVNKAGWGGVPTGCSVQYDGYYVTTYKDQSPHWSGAATSTNSRMPEFRAICKRSTRNALAGQWHVGADEVGPGYHKAAGTFQGKLPKQCEFCVGEKCKRHCIQAHLHGLKRDENKSLKEKLAKQLASVTAQKDTLASQLATAKKNIDYHGRKAIEWMTAARHQHDLDMALQKLKSSTTALKKAQEDFKNAKTSKEAALAKREIAIDMKKKAQALLDKSQAAAKLTKTELQQQQDLVKLHTQKLKDAQEKVAKLTKVLAKHEGDVVKYTKERNTHKSSEDTHETTRRKHEAKEEAARKATAKHGAASKAAADNHDALRERAKKSHNTAKGKFLEEEEEEKPSF